MPVDVVFSAPSVTSLRVSEVSPLAELMIALRAKYTGPIKEYDLAAMSRGCMRTDRFDLGKNHEIPEHLWSLCRLYIKVHRHRVKVNRVAASDRDPPDDYNLAPVRWENKAEAVHTLLAEEIRFLFGLHPKIDVEFNLDDDSGANWSFVAKELS